MVLAAAVTGGDCPAERNTKRRRLIYNDDGGALKHLSKPEMNACLDLWLAGLVGTQVDTVFFCGHDDFAKVFYNSKLEGVEINGSEGLKELLGRGVDPLNEIIDFCHRNELEIFYSCRMNDIHDSFDRQLGKFKRDHPEWLLGSPDAKYAPKSVKEAIWSSLDFAVPEVREHVKQCIREVYEERDWDGLEFDYGRNASLFRPTFEGRPVEQRHRDMLTEFQRQLRKMTREYSEKRNRPLLLAVVVPETVEISRDAGIDIEVWLKEQLVDMVIAGNGYVPFSTSMATLQMVELGHKYGVPVYPQINANTGDGLFKRNIEVWRAAGMNFWSTGGDGICLFNLFDMNGEAGKMTHRILTEIGDPAKIARQDKLYAADIDLETAGYGFGDIRFYMYRQNLVPMPLALPGSYVEFSVGDNLQGAAKEGILSELKLRLLIEGLAANDTLSLNFNGKALGGKQADAAFKANPKSHWREYDLNASDVKNGTNRIDAELTLSRSTKTAPKLSRLELSVRYRI